MIKTSLITLILVCSMALGCSKKDKAPTPTEKKPAEPAKKVATPSENTDRSNNENPPPTVEPKEAAEPVAKTVKPKANPCEKLKCGDKCDNEKCKAACNKDGKCVCATEELGCKPPKEACKPGATHAAKDGCNTCVCPEDGDKAKSKCTKLSCAKAIKVADVGLATPESVLYDAAADVYLVSNINGNPLKADGNGFISRITPDGKVDKLKWIDGETENTTLNAPKGMAILGDILYVTDINTIRMFDRTSGESKGQVKIRKATFLNDLANGPDGVIYVSDSGLTKGFKPSGTDAVYAIKGGKATALTKKKTMGRPNGLLYENGNVWVVSFGSGEVYSLGVDGTRDNVIKPAKGQLDGLERADDGELIFSSWEAGAIYKGPTGGPFNIVISGLKAPADIGWDSKRKRVLIPLFNDNAIHIQAL